MDSLQLLNTVNGFYDQAFNKLLIVTFGVIAFIGVLVPLVVGWVQIRSLRTEKDSISRDLKSEIETEKRRIREAIEQSVRDEMKNARSEFARRIEELSGDLKKSAAAAEARALHIQGISSLERGNAPSSVEDFAAAVPLYIAANDELNAQRCIESLIDFCLPRTDKEEFKRYKVKGYCEILLKSLRESDENGRYFNSIEKIEKALDLASNRAVPRKSTGGA
ncbi:hypothetical protein [Hylemonella gracilis]|uniref:hypothetical protein n=1 Tax=Hylemonella gracilis TaxID=80880 RepID=UPI0012DF9600|nr:hypothetical protein [Hylemonella gracilis]